ncbi:MAG: hypothetical protein A2W90_13000 [Bacteroidetes bacterium GWF2_42_66]|nr:MAG: hypothetical protein A2W92_19490 [Bacteroidetes bacterium GWA2_42_15]OFY00138.1 MAG: hypothetical protein A2W89_17990 [Bacteroidetes bacterium GWE2_42_39]OFY40280.1 MAG: hypothetical protein A2W90_13000 [Bacteroidetes bacterium GWF2_42_66]HBL73739.1 VTC domain-containing protein [Prolixibacteraceae bacterium]HCR91202.1 VTC domain-containing protein [Prolixibacteraceae bacterium]
MDSIRNILLRFDKVSLAELDQVRLMNRTDQKFCLHFSQLPAILEAICKDYSVLEIQGETIFEYDNIYFDTPDNRMFLSHQNGKLNRFKIRSRQYVQSNDNFLEIKFKSNKGRTIKERIEKHNFQAVFEDNELDFLQNLSPYSGLELRSKIASNFNRITLVNNLFTERMTIDTFLGFKNQEKEILLENLVVIEVKQSKVDNPAIIAQVLRANKIRKQSFSKYCIGRSLLEEEIKKNNFKPLLLKIRKEYII